MKETIIRLTDSNLVDVETKDESGVSRIKTITLDDLADIISASRNMTSGPEKYFDTGILPMNMTTDIYTVAVRTYDGGTQKVVLYQKPHRTNITYYDTEFKDVGIPGLIYIITYGNMQAKNIKVFAVKDNYITGETKIYRYPFSNVGREGSICFGRNNIFEIKYQHIGDLHSIPKMFLSMPNNDDSYGGSNSSGLAQRKLLEELEGKDFNNDYLVHHNMSQDTTMQTLINSL